MKRFAALLTMLVVLALAGAASAQTTSTISTQLGGALGLETKAGVLTSAQAATGVGSGRINCDGADLLVVETDLTAGTATIAVTNYLPGGAAPLTVGSTFAASTITRVTDPVGWYALNVSACSSCAVTSRAVCVDKSRR